MKCLLILTIALCATFAIQAKSIQQEEHLDTRNAVVDKILEELLKAKDAAEKLLKEAKAKLNVAKEKALKEWEILKVKIEAAAAKGEAISQELIAEAKAKILEEYQIVKPIIEELKAKAKARIETIVQQIKDSDVVANIKSFAEKVEAAIKNFINHIPDYEQQLKAIFEDVKSVVLIKAELIKEKLIKVEAEAKAKIEGFVAVAKKVLEEEIEPKIKAEIEDLIAIAKEKLDLANEAAKKAAAKLEAKVDALLELINDKTGGVSQEFIKKYEEKIAALIAEADKKITALKEKAEEILEKVKITIENKLHLNDEYSSKSDKIVDMIMEKLAAPIAKLPSSIQDIATSSIETALRFGLKMGKTVLMKLLDMVGDKFGDNVKAVTDMAKLALSMVYKRGATTEVVVAETLKALEGPLEKLPADIRDWVKVMIEEALRFGLGHGKNGINHLLDLVSDKFGDDVKPVIDAVKDIIDNVVYSAPAYGKAIDFTVEKIMKALEKPLAKLPENIKVWVTQMIEEAIRFGLGAGKNGAIVLLDFIGEKVGGDVKPIIEMVKVMLNMQVYKMEVRGSGADAAVSAIMAALDKPFSELPEDIRAWVELMIEQVLRFGLAHGKTGVIKGLEQINELTNGKVSTIIDVVKEMLDKYVYSTGSRAAGIDYVMEKIMGALEKPFSKIPEDIRVWVTGMVEEAIRFAFTHGKTGANHLLDLIGDKFGPEVAMILQMVKTALDQYI